MYRPVEKFHPTPWVPRPGCTRKGGRSGGRPVTVGVTEDGPGVDGQVVHRRSSRLVHPLGHATIDVPRHSRDVVRGEEVRGGGTLRGRVLG